FHVTGVQTCALPIFGIVELEEVVAPAIVLGRGDALQFVEAALVVRDDPDRTRTRMRLARRVELGIVLPEGVDEIADRAHGPLLEIGRASCRERGEGW